MIYKNSLRRQDAFNDFWTAMIDYHIYLDGERQYKSDVFDRHYQDPLSGDWANSELELIKGKCHPKYTFVLRPSTWTDKTGATHLLEPNFNGREAEAETTNELIRQRCMAELRKLDIMANDKNDITLSYDKLLGLLTTISGKLLNQAFKIWEEV